MGKQESLIQVQHQVAILKPQSFDGLSFNGNHNNGSGEKHFDQWEIKNGDNITICFYPPKEYHELYKDNIKLMIRNVASYLRGAPIFRIIRNGDDFKGIYQNNFRRWSTNLTSYISNHGIPEKTALEMLNDLGIEKISMTTASVGDNSFFFLTERNSQKLENHPKIFRVAPITEPFSGNPPKLMPLGPII